MAEIASFGVNVDQNTRLAQNAQDTANKADTGIGDLNDPNLMSVIEKQTQASQYAGLTSQYNVILARAKEANISTAALIAAYNNLDTFMTVILTDTTKASDVNRGTYKSLTDAYNTALSNVQNALKDAYNNDIDNMQSSVSIASQAASSAVIVASQATVTGNSASQVASQVAVVASQAQIDGSNATSVANNASQAASSATVQASVAVSNANVANNNATSGITIARSAANDAAVVSKAVTALKGGSTLTMEQLESGLRTKITARDITGGGTNLITNSDTTMTINGNTDHYKVIFSNLSLGAWTFSTNAKYTQGSPTAVTVLVYDAGHKNAIISNNTVEIINGRLTTTFTITDSSAKELLIYAGDAGYNSTTGNILQIDHYQLETGIVAHDWRPAPEDFSQLVETKTADLAETMVKNSDFATYKDQTADTIQNIVTKSPSNIIKDGSFNSAVVGKVPSGWDWSTLGQIVANPNMSSNLVATGHPVLQINSLTSGNSDIYYGDWFDVQPGDQFYTEFKARWSSTSQKGKIVLGVVTKDATGHWIWTNGASTSSPGNWSKYTGILTIPAGAVQGRVWVSWQGSTAANEAVFVTDLVVRPAYSTQSDITQSINNIHLGFKNPDGSKFQMNLSADGTALLDFSKIMLKGQTNIANGTIGNAQIANGAINQAKIGKLAVGNAQIANGAITNAKIGNVSANKLTAGTIDFNTITGKNINASNITTGKLSTDRLNVDKLSAVSANLGNITTGSLKGVDVVAKTFSTPNGSFTTDANGAITAKNMTLTGGTFSSPTISAGIINGSTINGTTFNAGNRIDNSNNTSNWYPLTINPDGDLTSTHIENGAGLQTYISGGTVNTRYNRFATNGYGQYTSNFISMGGDGSISVTSNGTTNKDTAFNAPIASTYGAVYITPGGISLHGDNESLRFRGTSKIGTNGIRMDNYGNIHGDGTSAWWRVDDSSGSHVASFGTAPGNNITFSKPLFVDEIGGYSSNNGHALLIHGDDAGKSGSTGQMEFKKDNRSAVVLSASIHNRTYSSGSTVTVTSHGTLGRITSASKYKYNIKHAIDEDSLADKLLTMHVSTWNDKSAVDSYAQTLTDNTESEDISIKDNYGLIAEDLRDAGLDMFIEYGKNHTIEGIEYDRAWLPLLPKMRQMNDKINEYELRISKLEAKINE